MPTRLLAVLVALSLASPTPDAGAAEAECTRFVDDLSTDCTGPAASPGSGTFTDPWKNMQYATKQLACGDVLCVRRGTYRVDHAGFGTGTGLCENGTNGEASVVYLANRTCDAAHPVTVRPYDGGSGPETVIVDGTSAQIDDASPASHWTRCEGPTQCGACTGLTLQDYTRTYYSEAYNFSSVDTEQVWIDPQCNDADDPTCTDPVHSGTRINWRETSANGGCADLNLLDGSCQTAWMGGAGLARSCGSFNTRALANAIVMRLPDVGQPGSDWTNPDPDAHVVKISCQAGTCANAPVEIRNHPNAIVRGLVVKYGYNDVDVADSPGTLLDGLTMSPAGGRDYGHCVGFANGTDVTVQNSVCQESASEGIAFYTGANCCCQQGANATVQDSVIHDTGFASNRGTEPGFGAVGELGDGVICKSTNNCRILRNRIYNTSRWGVNITSDAHYDDACPVSVGGSGCSNRCCAPGPDGTKINATELAFLCSSNDALVEGNVFAETSTSIRASQYGGGPGADSAAISAKGQEGPIARPVIRNNVVAGIYDPTNSASAIRIDSGVTNVTLVNNTLQDTASAAVNLRGSSGPTDLINNILTECSKTGTCNGGTGCCLMADSAGQLGTHTKNIYWGPSSSTTVVKLISGGTYTRSGVASFEPAAVIGDPRLTSLTDPHLLSDSAARGAGATVAGLLVDFEGQPRPTASPDIGADQFDSTPVPTATLSATPTLTPLPTPTATGGGCVPLGPSQTGTRDDVWRVQQDYTCALSGACNTARQAIKNPGALGICKIEAYVFNSTGATGAMHLALVSSDLTTLLGASQTVDIATGAGFPAGPGRCVVGGAFCTGDADCASGTCDLATFQDYTTFTFSSDVAVSGDFWIAALPDSATNWVRWSARASDTAYETAAYSGVHPNAATISGDFAFRVWVRVAGTPTPTATPTPALPTATATVTSTAATPTPTPTLSPTPTATATPANGTCLLTQQRLTQKLLNAMPLLAKELCR